MNSEQLRALQAPVKEKYKQDPGAAKITLRAQGKLGDEKISCKVQTGKALVEAGLHPGTGGAGDLACSGDMLLEALAACFGVTLKAVATAISVPIEEGTVTAEGDLDFRGTLGVSKEVPVGFSAIRLLVKFKTDAEHQQIEKLLSLTERYCVVAQTLWQPPTVSVDYKS